MIFRLLCLAHQRGREEVAVHAGDVGQLDLLRALCLAGTDIRAVAKSFLIHLLYHAQRAEVALRLALRQEGELGYFSGHEEHRSAIRAGSYAGATADAGSSIHRLLSVMFVYRQVIGILSLAGIHTHKATRSDDTVKRRAVSHEILYDRESLGPPWLYVYRIAVFEGAQVQLAGSSRMLRTVCTAIYIHAAHTADTLAAVMVKAYWLLTLLDQLVIQHVYHLQKRHIRIQVVYRIVYQFAGSIGILLSPDFEIEFHII